MADPKEGEKEITDDIDEIIGDTNEGAGTLDMLEIGISDSPGDIGATGDVGLEELAARERLEEEDAEKHELKGVPSDLLSVGDPNAGDVGIPGGLAAGGDQSLGGSGGIEKSEEDEWNDIEGENRGFGGTGIPHKDGEDMHDLE